MFSYKSLIVRAFVLKSVNPSNFFTLYEVKVNFHVPLMNIQFLKTLYC